MSQRETGLFKYSPSAVDRIRAMDKGDIVAFFDEVSPRSRKRSVETLPNPPGFRAGSPSGVKRQFQLLVNRLIGNRARNPTSIQRDLNVLGRVWMVWGTERLGAGDEIEEFVGRANHSEADGLAAGDDVQADQDDPLATELFRRLRDLSHSNRCGREELRRFLQFSPFTATAGLLRIVEDCKPSTQIEHERTLSELPDRVREAQEGLADLSGDFSAFSKTYRQQVLALRKDVETLQTAVSEVKETASSTVGRVEALRSEVTAQGKRMAEDLAAQEQSLGAVEQLENALAAIPAQIEPLSDRMDNIDDALRSLRLELEQLRERITECREVVDRASVSESSTETDPTTVAKPVSSTRTITLEKRALADTDPGPAQLEEVDGCIRAVRRNLELLSVKKSSAEALALECMAALLAGQIPYFAGLNGKRVAEACATALAAQDTHILTVPVGLSSPNEFRHHVEALPASETQSATCLILDGINRSALDTFGECLVDIVSRPRSGDLTSRCSLVLATLTEGPASLPLSLAHISLGPVFFTDALEWRSRPRTSGQMTCGAIPAAEWEASCRIGERFSTDAEEALRLLGEFVPFANPLLRATVLGGVRTLSALRRNEDAPTVLQSLAFGWLTPLCIVAGTSCDAVNQEFDQGIVDGNTPDQRLLNLLRSGVFPSPQIGTI